MSLKRTRNLYGKREKKIGAQVLSLIDSRNNTLMSDLHLWLFVCMSLILSGMASLKLFSLHSSFMDLGVFEWNFWSIVFNGQWKRAFWGHAQPLIFILDLGYRVFKSSYFLVIWQAVLLAAPILLIPEIVDYFRLSNGKSGHQAAFRFLPVAAYILFFPVWFNALFDFHMDHIAVPLGFLFYLACFKKRWGWAVAAGIALSLIKEPFALMTAACGLYILAMQAAGRCSGTGCGRDFVPYAAGIFLVVFGLFYFYIAVNVISPIFSQGKRAGLDSSAYSWLGTGMMDMLLYVLGHPLAILDDIFSTPGKIVYLLAVFGSLVFVPLLSPLELIPALPVLAISMLSRLDNYYGLGNHYTAGLIAPLVVAFISGLPKAMRLAEKMGLSRRVFCFSLIGVMLAANILISPSPISRLFWTNKIWSYGYTAYLPNERSRMITEAVKKYIPSDPKVAVATQNDLYLSYLGRRKVCLPFPESVLKPHTLPDWEHSGRNRTVLADYVVLDLKRPLFLSDKGCDWQYGECRNTEFVKRFMDTVAATKKLFIPVYERDGFMILKREQPQ